jgi:hypothetical protein
MLAAGAAAGYHFLSGSKMSQTPADSQSPMPQGAATRVSRPLERFWPYQDLPEEATPEELAALDPDLHAALFGTAPGPFTLTLQFTPFDGPDFARAIEMARASRDYREVGQGDDRRHRATFQSTDAVELHELFQIVDGPGACEVLVDGRPVPFARELWLPLVWLLLPR